MLTFVSFFDEELDRLFKLVLRMGYQDDHLTIVQYLMRGRSIISSSKGLQQMMTIYNLQSFITLGNEDITFEDGQHDYVRNPIYLLIQKGII